MSRKKAQALEKGITNTSGIFSAIGMAMLLVLMLLGAGDVIGRCFFNKPIPGTLEVGEILLAGIVFFAWARTQVVGAHVRVGFIVSRFSLRAQAILGFLGSLVGLVLFSLIVWQGVKAAMLYWQLNRLIPTILIPSFPFQLLVPVGGSLFCVVLIVQMLHFIGKMKRAG